jgi:hypothetical protein
LGKGVGHDDTNFPDFDCIIRFIVCTVYQSLVDEPLILSGEQRRGQREKVDLPATLGLDQGLIEFDTPEFTLKLVRASQPSGEL